MNEPCAKITLDVQQASTATFVAVKRGDIGRKIVISLSDGGFPYEIAADCYAVLTGTKPDGNILYNHCDIEGNTIVYEITEQTTAAAGRIKAEVKLYSADDALVTSATFRIIVDGTVYQDGQVESSSEFSALTQLMRQTLTLLQNGTGDSSGSGIATLVVSQLPTEDISYTTMYLVPDGDDESNIYTEYMYINGSWEIIGSQQIEVTPENGADGGYYSPKVTKLDDNTMEVSFTPSKANMPAVEPVQVTLPRGSDSGGNAAQASVEPAYEDIPKVFFGSHLPQTKDDTTMSFRYVSKTKDINGYCKTKAQGDSTMSYPKKNQTVKLYTDAECTENLNVNFKGWGPQNKFCFKANWIDLTHARNIVSSRLWGDIVKSRADYAELPELLRTSPNQGAIDGFQVKVYADGVYQGRYTINIPKDKWMANMDDDLDAHCILCGESGDSAQFKAAAVIDGTDWTDEIHDIVPSSILTRWNEVIDFVMNSTNDEFVKNLAYYFDVQSLIDYYLFGLASNNFDGFQKNQLYMTYDRLKWYACAYDMDATWGLWWDGSYFVDYDYPLGMAELNQLFSRLLELFFEDMQTRWTELRGSILSEANIINEFERFTDICPPWLVSEDYAETTADGAFTEIPSQGTNNIQQLRDYIVKRLDWADRKMSGDENLLYRLQNVAFAQDTTIDTGVKLFEAAHEATIFLDFVAETQPGDAALLWTKTEDFYDPNPVGVNISSSGNEWITVFINGKERRAATSWMWRWDTTRAIAITLTGEGTLGTCKFLYNTGLVEEFTFEEMTFVASNGTLVLGSKSRTNKNWSEWTGTLNDFRVWNRAFSNDEIAALFAGVTLE